MAVNPWGQQSDENIEGIMAKAAHQVKKTAANVVKTVASDAKQQLTGDWGPKTEQGQGQPQTSKQQAGPNQPQLVSMEEKKSKETLLVQTRQNLEKINKDIQMIRQKRAQEQQQKEKAETQKKEQKKQLAEKKKEDPFWKKLLQGKTGSKEGNVRASG